MISLKFAQGPNYFNKRFFLCSNLPNEYIPRPIFMIFVGVHVILVSPKGRDNDMVLNSDFSKCS